MSDRITQQNQGIFALSDQLRSAPEWTLWTLCGHFSGLQAADDSRRALHPFSRNGLITSIMRTTKVTSLSLPPKLLREAERLARREGRTKSELLREALRRYVADSRWRELQEFGRSQARKLAIEESDVERLVAEYRAEH
ncbi:MAG: ribbon-helix-helix protein, CopG family [Candidatus Binataceae bacterium]